MSNQSTENKALAVIDPAVMQHKKFLDTRQDALAKWIVGGVRPEALIRFALHDLSTNEKLRACSPQSIYLGLLACAVTGLEPGSLKGEAYLVPFKEKAQFIPGWKGIVKQARRSQAVKTITANVVFERDTFDIDLGTANRIIHRPALSNRGDVIGAYAWAQMVDGSFEHEWLDIEDLNAIQRVAESRGKSPAWADWPDQMQRKSALRRLGKRLPLGEDYYRGLAIEHAVDQGGSVREQLDIITDGDASATGGSEGMSVAQFMAPEPRIAVDPRTSVQAPGVFVPTGTTSGSGVTPGVLRVEPQGPPPGVPQADPPRRGRPPKADPTPPASSPSTSTPTHGPSPASNSTAAEPSKPDAAVQAVRDKEPPVEIIKDMWGQPIAVDPTPPSSTMGPTPSGESAAASTAARTSGAAPDAGGNANAEGFGSDDPVATQPPPKTMDDFHKWLAGCKTQRDLSAGLAEWRAWSKHKCDVEGDKAFHKTGPATIAMQDAYAKRKSEVPA